MITNTYPHKAARSMTDRRIMWALAHLAIYSVADQYAIGAEAASRGISADGPSA